MCELFAVSSPHRVAIDYSLNEFSRHGGLSHLNKSGWGMSFQQNSDTLLIKEAKPAFDSPWVKFVAEQQTRSHCIIAHVRYATTGEAVYEDTHPFKREAYGRAHVFAHNGDLADFRAALPLAGMPFKPMGETDSEHAFCYMLDKLAPLWREGIPPVERRLAVIAAVAAEIRELGSSNFLYSDSDCLFVHSDLRRFDENGIFGPRRAPALHWIDRRDLHASGLNVTSPDSASHNAMMFASVPLSDDDWQPLPRGSVLAVRNGKITDRTDIGEGIWSA
ncbi:class II glutamine amidotransferase [Sneathiella sp.]|uniref:class II glutamine amidotransferase n=1 Tax=Sneathiella sp. TaxID=1964365 RepID=UPI00356ADBBA